MTESGLVISTKNFDIDLDVIVLRALFLTLLLSPWWPIVFTFLIYPWLKPYIG